MMRSFKFGEDGKVVRGKIPALTEQSGGSMETRRLYGEDAFRVLLNKAIEEINELGSASMSDRPGEIADLKAVVEAIVLASGIPLHTIDAVETDKDRKKGTFYPAVLASGVVVQNGDPMAEYYASDPERFIEVTEGLVSTPEQG